MIIEKQVTITISGDEVQTLSNICECARVYLDQHLGRNWRRGEYDVGQWTGKETYAIGVFIDKILDV